MLERRYRMLTAQLRCSVCQNQNIADSHTELAEDLRRKVYELLNSGNACLLAATGLVAIR
jgi:cytochrome c-type biogenesis protein CcmH